LTPAYIPGEDGRVISITPGYNWTHATGCSIAPRIDFRGKYSKLPRLITGISLIDAGRAIAPNFALGSENLTTKGFNARIRTLGQTQCVNMALNWMVLPDNGIHMEAGEVHTSGIQRKELDPAYIRLYFPQPFEKPPVVRCWFKSVEFGAPRPTDYYALKTFPANIEADSFTVAVESWYNRGFVNASVGWFAYDQKAHGIQIRSDDVKLMRDDPDSFTLDWKANPLQQKPSQFIAICAFDINGALCAKVRANNDFISSDGATFTLGRWDKGEADIYHIVGSYIVM
jgi:hypothetical protein